VCSVGLSTREFDGEVVVALRGELDVADAVSVAAAVAERVIIVDLADLHFIDSSGLTALACGWRSCRRSGAVQPGGSTRVDGLEEFQEPLIPAGCGGWR
jgi:anti-anti-sigma factor